jgi:hypothetical protein
MSAGKKAFDQDSVCDRQNWISKTLQQTRYLHPIPYLNQPYTYLEAYGNP